MPELDPYLEKLPYWKDLSAEERDFVRENASLPFYPAGSVIYGSSTACLGMIYVVRGSIRVFFLSDEGREVTLFRLSPGDSCVLSASCVIEEIDFDTQRAVEEDCDVLVVRPNAFAALAERNIYVRCYMFEDATERFSSVMWVMQQILFARFDQRLASFLLRESARLGTDGLRMTHEQIAQQVSSAREVVARMLKRFAAEGLVSMSRGQVTILDRAGLRKLL